MKNEKSALETFIKNAVSAIKVLDDLGELDFPEQFRDELKAARAELSTLRSDAAAAREKAIEECAKVCDIAASQAREAHPDAIEAHGLPADFPAAVQSCAEVLAEKLRALAIQGAKA